MIKSIISGPLRKLYLKEEEKLTTSRPGYVELVLGLLDAAAELKDLDFPTAGLSQLSEDHQDFWSVSVNDTYHHFIFRFENGNITDLDIPNLELDACPVVMGNILVRSPMRNPPHPGQVLMQLYLNPLELTPIKAAQGLGILRKTLSQLMKGHQPVTPDMTLRLAEAFNTTPQLWLNLQHNFNLRQVGNIERGFKVQHFYPTEKAAPSK